MQVRKPNATATVTVLHNGRSLTNVSVDLTDEDGKLCTRATVSLVEAGSLRFLHLDTRAEGGWSLISFVFTIVIVGILISGSVWIMYHLNTNLMPVNAQDSSQAP